MEKNLVIPTADNHNIYGVLNWKESSWKLVIFVHGFTGNSREAHYYNGKEFFVEKGYEVCRFDLYSGWEKARKLHETSVSEHALDISKVLEYFSWYEDIFLVWHSLGWPSIVWMKDFPKNLKKIVFWDPAFDTSTTLLKCFEQDGKYFYDPKNGRITCISQQMYQELKENPWMEYLKNIDFEKENISIIYAWAHWKIQSKPQTDNLWISSWVIEWANHGFSQEGKYEELFGKTLEFIEK